MRFRGHLELPHDPDSRLPVDLRVDDNVLSLTSGDEDLGTWPTGTVRLKARDDGRFDLRVGDEKLLFAAEDSVSFKHTGMPAIMGKAAGEEANVFDKLKSRLRPRSTENGPPAATKEPTTDREGSTPLWEAAEPDSPPAMPPPGTGAEPDSGLPDVPASGDAAVSNGGEAQNVALVEPAPDEPPGWQQTGAATVEAVAAPVEKASGTSFGVVDSEAGNADDDPGGAILVRLTDLVIDVREGRVDPARGSAIADLVRSMCRVIELDGNEPGHLREIADMIEAHSGLGPTRNEDQP